VDTVEWGSVDPDRRRLPSLKYTVPRAGALVLAVGGFLALVAAELLPWGTVQLPGSSPVTVPHSLFSNGAGIGLMQLNSTSVLAYHLAAVVLLGALGFGLAGSAARRRAAMGATLGLAAGLAMMVISVHRAATHFFDNYYNGFGYGPEPPASSEIPAVITGPGSYLAFVAVGLLAGAAVTAAIWQRGWWQSRSAVSARAGKEQVEAVPTASLDRDGGDRELTVSALEPLDERHFARPDRG
jgi:hypothetical protein